MEDPEDERYVKGFLVIEGKDLPSSLLEEFCGIANVIALDATNDKRIKLSMSSKLNSIQARDDYTGNHCYRVGLMSYEIAREMGLSPRACILVYNGGRIHDIGKLAIRDAVLNKDGPLDKQEREKIEEHPQLGFDIVSDELGSEISPMVLHHHENWDGRGYPNGLRGEEIPVEVRILTVADHFDALTSDRPYRRALGCGEALSIMEGESGQKFEPAIFDTFKGPVLQKSDEMSTIMNATV